VVGRAACAFNEPKQAKITPYTLQILNCDLIFSPAGNADFCQTELKYAFKNDFIPFKGTTKFE
jgi:hypothetical protein